MFSMYSAPMPIAVLIATLSSFPAFGEELTGTLLKPTQPAPIRTAPPSGFWRTPGEQTGVTAPGTDYVILDQLDVQSGLSALQIWVEVAPIDPETGEINAEQGGWAYFGQTDTATRSLNFEPAAPAPTPSVSPDIVLPIEGN